MAKSLLQTLLKFRVVKEDTHREPFDTKEQSTIPTLLPPPVVSSYDNVYPVTLNSQHGPKLIIGTQTMNYLVAFFVRLDKEEKTKCGGCINIIQIGKIRRIFFNKNLHR
ncbi:hypothetical protein G6F47_001069 [Rhizopus delemar]|uniref:Uncharacterized protein n=2 Tax=Rhizopus delemar TaxID=936053 RepID=I1CAD0_RHIO9|nr:hypothetical protein RO3G_10120 [Rhizopus delemar RA 99-880]KAG1568045.1 hypothetical protein G6F50_007651 [Rhizopus delemar]KAG1637609.1 hypothetical protein G6F45_000432 [Rhizopus arrhizus]KAG1593875.1 hypothetical protein G6F48_001717 [Rhizopus delemar]KAG1604280.1 hypothetical protein G6F47_001069 [Rhizopus delemar]|eukprot:EIE85410.1 hypothetical protein RO3G_10120 [Rhizopus delemar RA 99-880]